MTRCDALHPAADLDRHRPVLRRAGRAADARRRCRPLKTLEGATQTIARGPVASQEAIKELGTNGGGFFNTNSAHPFENPSPLTNLIEMVMILAIPFGLAWTFGRMVGNVKQGIAIAGAMAFILVIGVAVAVPAEKIGNPAFTQLGINQASNGSSPGGNMEGKEVRFGPILSRPVGNGDDGHVERRRSTPSTTASRRLAGWSRWSTSSSARSRPAVSAPDSTACSSSPCLPSSSPG